MDAKKPVIRGGSAMSLAERLGWMGSVERRAGMRAAPNPSATVPEIGEMVDVSVFALQDMLTIVGTYSGPKDGNWSPAVQDALNRWNQPDPAGAARFTMTVVPKPDDPQTVGFRRQVFDALRVDAEHAVGRPSKPWYFWPLVLTGSVAGIYLLVYVFSKAKGKGVSDFQLARRRHGKK
jgi:hypothetical protein